MTSGQTRFERSYHTALSVPLRYALAVAITEGITLLRLALNPLLNDNSVYTFYIASVVLAAWYLGLGPSLLNVVSGAAAGMFFFAPPRWSFHVHEFRHVSGLVVFMMVSSYLAYLIHCLRRDIARRKKAEADLMAAQEVMQAHQAELARAGRLSLMGEMTATLAHELNQPLHSARNYAQGSIRRLRKNPASDPQIIAALEHISESSDRAAEILRRVRDFINPSGPKLEQVHIGEILRDAVAIVNLGPVPQRAKVVFDIAADLPPAEGDKVELEQVIVNLVRNGLEAMDRLSEDQRVLCLGARRRDERTIEVFVRDSGAGIPADTAERIFEPFFTTKAEGMGMGLAICRSIIQRHEGQLWFTASDNGNTTFHFTLPIEEVPSQLRRPHEFVDDATAGEEPPVLNKES